VTGKNRDLLGIFAAVEGEISGRAAVASKIR